MRFDEPVTINQVAASALAREGVITRHLTQMFLRQTPRLVEVSPPNVDDSDILATSAALIELFAERRKEAAPKWTTHIQRQGTPIFLLTCRPETFTYRLCLEESPPPLRKRGLYAPDNYLTFA